MQNQQLFGETLFFSEEQTCWQMAEQARRAIVGTSNIIYLHCLDDFILLLCILTIFLCV